MTVAAGLILALLYSNLDVSIFLRGAWGLAILLGGVMGLFMFVLHMTVEAVELRVLRGIDSISAREFPPPLVAMEERVRLLPRVGFVVLTAALLLMMYAAHGA